MKRIIVLIAILFAPLMAHAADHYIRAGAAGTADGSSWTNAWATLGAVTWTAGDKYWIANGSYGALTTSVSGSSGSPITLLGATVSSHGPALDWNNAYAGTATFTHMALNNPYWVINGQQRGSAGCISTPSTCTPADWKTGYTIKIVTSNSFVQCIVPVSNITIQYLECAGRNTVGVDDYGVEAAISITNFIWDHGYIHDTGNSPIQANNGFNDNITLSYDYIFHNHTANDATHDEALAMPWSHAFVHHNFFHDIVSTAIWSDASGAYQPDADWEFYGNIIFYDNNFWSSIASSPIDNGAVHYNGSPSSVGPAYVYNNTFVNAQQVSASATFLSNTAGSGPFLVENNITCNGGNSNSQDSGTTVDYNTFYCGDTAARGSHSSNVAGNPFQNAFPSPYGNTWDASLSVAGESAMSTGVTLAAPYNTSCDAANGWCVNSVATLTRGANGKWDRGALQIGAGTAQLPPNPPGNLQVVSVQ